MSTIATSRVKRFLAIGLVITALLAVSIGLVGLGFVTQKTSTGASPADAFNEIPLLPPSFADIVTWLPDGDLDRQVEPTTRRNVEAAWVRAWSRVDDAQRSGERSGIDVWFIGGLANQAAETTRSTQPARLVQHQHELEVSFYSIDGSILTLNGTSDLERTLFDGPALRSTDQYEAVFVLSDGNWRLQQLHRQ